MEEDAESDRQIRELLRALRGLVRQQTAASNHIHAIADQLFPGFPDSSKSAVTAFTDASLGNSKGLPRMVWT